jgi:ribose 5-phosphate isomerase B
MRIVVGADHAGYSLKQEIVNTLRTGGHQVEDVGTHSAESTDYPDYAILVARTVTAGRADLGIAVCGTGIGVSMAANKVPGARAAVATNCFMARMAREHNDANVLCLGGRVLGVGLALDIVQAFLQGQFLGGRHAQRVDKIKALEGKESSHA